MLSRPAPTTPAFAAPVWIVSDDAPDPLTADAVNRRDGPVPTPSVKVRFASSQASVVDAAATFDPLPYGIRVEGNVKRLASKGPDVLEASGHKTPAVIRNSTLLPDAHDAADVPSIARSTVNVSPLRRTQRTISQDVSLPAWVKVAMKKSPPLGDGKRAPSPVANVSVVVDVFTDDASVLCALLAKSCAMVSWPR